MSDIKALHEKIIKLSLGDLLLLAAQAVNLPMDDERLDIILKYVEIALAKRKLLKPRVQDRSEGD